MSIARITLFYLSVPPYSSSAFNFFRSKFRSSSMFALNSSPLSVNEETIEKNLLKNQGPPLPTLPSTSKRIFYVRHGEVIPPGGVHGVFYGCMDVPLSPLGELEAKVAGLYLKQTKLQKIASSPLKRAKFGANELLKYQKQNFEPAYDVEIYQGFTELDRGEWCGKTKIEIGESNLARFDNCDESITPKGGESYPTLKSRVLQARDELLNSMENGQTAALVSHLQVTRSVLSDALDIPTNKMTEMKIKTASITCIDYDYAGENSGKPTVQFSSFKPEVGLEEANDGGNFV